MKALDLLKFVENNNCEYFWVNKDVFLFIDLINIEEFNKILGYRVMGREGIKCTMKLGYFCFKMKDICEYFYIELSKIFAKQN
jgi:hypothetical protein